ncbi:MAG: DUF4175 family protein, partial [Thermoanaerobaculia bacterium]|nr:DUF4175 family protein [Thermoanaerobaculia bacterium]
MRPRGPIARWVARRARQVWAEELTAAAATAFVAAGLLTRMGAPGALSLGAGLAAAGLLLWQCRRRLRVAAAEVAAHLDRVVPELEESAGLLLEPEESGPLVARLQRRRAARALAGRRDLLPRAPWLRAAAWCVGGLSLALLLAGSPGEGRPAPSVTGESATAEGPMPVRPAAIEVEVRPPAYTGRPARRGGELSVEVEEGGRVVWRVRAETALEAAELVFEDGERLALDPVGEGIYSGSLRPAATRLYWLRLSAAGREAYRGDFARLRVLPDRPPEVAWERPEERVEEVAPDAAPVPVRLTARDEYGVVRMELVATLASGSGEMVSFRERRLPLDLSAGPEGVATGVARLDLAALGLEPGSELYLVAEAWDGRRPEANRGRSDARILRMSGPRVRTADLGDGLPVLPLPTLFRSQRQIILDTEKLLADRPRITREELARRSAALGFDQRALRMRYAGLLGEEFETGVPEEEEEEAPEEWPQSEGDDVSEALDALPDGFVHSHDWGEINTYFDDRVRARLKQAMGEMWGAEGRLRSIDPSGALPFEYRALAALKAAQEAERVYVRKTGFEPPPL